MRRGHGFATQVPGKCASIPGIGIGGQQDHINSRILHSGSKARYQGDSQNHALYDSPLFIWLTGGHETRRFRALPASHLSKPVEESTDLT